MAAGGRGVADPLSPAGVPCAFSPLNQAYFALASADGQLRVWETANNRLHQEYVPSAHLSGTCTCLAWAPARLQAKVKQAGRRGAGVRPGSASVHPRPHGAWPGSSRGPARPGARRHRAWRRRRRGLHPLRQSRVRPVRRVAKEGAAGSVGPLTGVPPTDSMRSVPRAPLSSGPPCSHRPPVPQGGLLLPSLSHQHVLFSVLAFDRVPPWDCTVLFRFL